MMCNRTAGLRITRPGASIVLGILLAAGSLKTQALYYLSVVNNYSQIQPGMPNYGIAQGSIFMLGDSGDLADTTASQGVPLQTTLAGVTITVTVGNVMTTAIPYYVSPHQIDAILPSSTPVGEAIIAVTSPTISAENGGRAASISTTVVPSAFGLATVSALAGASVAAAVAQDDNEGSQSLNQANAANPGEYITLWGSGLGPVSGNETQYQVPTDLTNIPIEVDIGGISATVTYHGRSIYPGLDQINVIVPQGVSGCNVSVVVTAGGVPSNVGTIPVTTSGRICSDPRIVPVTATEYQTLLSQSTVKPGAISLTSITPTNPFLAAAQATGTDMASAVFEYYTAQQFTANGYLQVPSLGSCIVTEYLATFPLSNSDTPIPLNAGPQINVSGPDGGLALPYGGGGYYNYGGASGMAPAIVPPGGGTFTFNNGSGGSDVGVFTATLSESLTIPLVWTNASAIAAVNRSQGQLVTWSGGMPGSFVSILGYTYMNQATGIANSPSLNTYFICSAPLSAGQFTVPAAVLENLAPTGTSPVLFPDPSGNGYLYVVNEISQSFSAPGLDFGLIFFGVGSGISVPFN